MCIIETWWMLWILEKGELHVLHDYDCIHDDF